MIDRSDPRLSWAKAYPFRQIDHSFTFIDGVVHPAIDISNRCMAVLAAGSNASPDQLYRKFGKRRKPITLSKVKLEGWVIAYSAHFAGYGSIPATLVACKTARTSAFISWLDPDDLDLMHASEALGVNYDYDTQSGLTVYGENEQPIQIDGFYRSRHGALKLDGKIVRIQGAECANNDWPALTQAQLLDYVAKRLAPELHADDFIIKIIEDRVFRDHCRMRLGELNSCIDVDLRIDQR